MARKKLSDTKETGVILRNITEPKGSIDFGKNHFNTPKQYGQKFKVDNSYYRLAGKPTLGLPIGSIETDPSDKIPKPTKRKKSTKRK